MLGKLETETKGSEEGYSKDLHDRAEKMSRP